MPSNGPAPAGPKPPASPAPPPSRDDFAAREKVYRANVDAELARLRNILADETAKRPPTPQPDTERTLAVGILGALAVVALLVVVGFGFVYVTGGLFGF